MNRLKKIVAGTGGSEIAEAALVLPILFMLLLGIYWFGRAFNVYATINHAAREGARLGTASTCATCGANPNTQPTPDQIAGQVKQALQASRLDPAQVKHLLGITRARCGGGPPVSCSVPAADPDICVYYNVQLNSLPPNSGAPACGLSVEFQYPYQFFFPFTSLNMQKIMLNAGVQMTGEY
ncbi:MAG TPA: TadE/TadG family type IV pilus assembly protein [Terriglobales bacterium]|nr:TadE/TadG family type IV pilus assembly protein [Terriglobales bacterium]